MKDFNQLIISGKILEPLTLSQDRHNNNFLTGEIENRRVYVNREGEQQEISRIGFVAWNRVAEAIAQGVQAGDTVLLHGKLKQEVWRDGRGVQRSELALNASGFLRLESAANGNAN